MANNLIIYYSRRGENYFGGSIRSINKGNTVQNDQVGTKQAISEWLSGLDFLG